MKTEKNIFIAFILNLSFSILEFFGGLLTGSVAIISDSVHDLGDAVSIGVSFVLEQKSKKEPDDKYTYGYTRYSVLGSVITTFVLLFGSVAVIWNSVNKIISPTPINYNGMIIFAIIGFCVNLFAAIITKDGDSLNQKAVNLHMIEDVAGWAVVLIGAVIMRFTSFSLIDPLISIGVSVFIFINALKNLKEVLDLFLEKTPRNIDVRELKEHICNINGVIDVHHLHVWSIDGQNNYATMHVVTNSDHSEIKEKIRDELLEHDIVHTTLELEDENETCHEKHCHVVHESHTHHHHHHH